MNKKENALQVFNFSEKSTPIRILTDENDELWFVAQDLCDALGIANSRDATSRLDEDEMSVSEFPTRTGMRSFTMVAESGMYAIMFRSNKPEAKALYKWIRKEVLPSIRKTGSYGTPAKQPRRYAIRGELINAEILRLLWLIGEMLPKGAQRETAIELGVSVQSVNYVLSGRQRSTRILQALYEKALKNRPAYMLYNQPKLMTKKLLGVEMSPEESIMLNSNPLPAVRIDMPDGKAVHYTNSNGKLGNQNARKHPVGHKQKSGAYYRRLRREKAAQKYLQERKEGV